MPSYYPIPKVDVIHVLGRAVGLMLSDPFSVAVAAAVLLALPAFAAVSNVARTPTVESKGKNCSFVVFNWMECHLRTYIRVSI